MQRGNTIYTSNQAALSLKGNCRTNWEQLGCKVYIRGTHDGGKNCQINGDDTWNAYQDVSAVSIDYYFECDNRDSGPNRLNTTLAMRTINGTIVDGSFVADTMKKT